jgi:hypothetical protein
MVTGVLMIGSFATWGISTLSPDCGALLPLPLQFNPFAQAVEIPPTQIRLFAIAKLLFNLLAAAVMRSAE